MPRCQRDGLNPRQEFAYRGVQDGAHFLGSADSGMYICASCHQPHMALDCSILSSYSKGRPQGGGVRQETWLTQQALRSRHYARIRNTELVVAVVDWESIYGSASKLWSDHHKYYHTQQHQSQQKEQFDHNDQMKSPQQAERRDQSRLQQQIGQQHQFGERQSVGRSQQDQGQDGCYKL